MRDGPQFNVIVIDYVRKYWSNKKYRKLPHIFSNWIRYLI